jgi:hypothetical protein
VAVIAERGRASSLWPLRADPPPTRLGPCRSSRMSAPGLGEQAPCGHSGMADPTAGAKPARPGLPTIGAVGGTYTSFSIDVA